MHGGLGFDTDSSTNQMIPGAELDSTAWARWVEIPRGDWRNQRKLNSRRTWRLHCRRTLRSRSL